MGCGPSKSKQTPAAEKKYETYDKEESTNDPPISDPSQATGVSGKVGGRTTTVDAGGPALENNVPKAEQNASSGAKVSESRDARAVTKGSTAPVAKVSSEATASSAKPSAKASAKPEASKVVSSPQLSPSPNKRRHVHDAAGHTELISQVVGTGSVLVAHKFMPIGMADFRRLFWTGGNFYRDFLSFSLGDESIVMSDWVAGQDEVLKGKPPLNSITRTITSKHPLAITFPGLSSFVDSTKVQVVAALGDDQLVVVETASFTGMPYADHFVVVARWVIMGRNGSGPPGSPTSTPSPLGAQGQGAEHVEIQIACEVVFKKSTMLKQRITANTVHELGKTYESWGALADKFLTLQKQEAAETNGGSPQKSPLRGGLVGDNDEVEPSVAAAEKAMANDNNFDCDDDDDEDDEFGGGEESVAALLRGMVIPGEEAERLAQKSMAPGAELSASAMTVDDARVNPMASIPEDRDDDGSEEGQNWPEGWRERGASARATCQAREEVATPKYAEQELGDSRAVLDKLLQRQAAVKAKELNPLKVLALHEDATLTDVAMRQNAFLALLQDKSLPAAERRAGNQLVSAAANEFARARRVVMSAEVKAAREGDINGPSAPRAMELEPINAKLIPVKNKASNVTVSNYGSSSSSSNSTTTSTSSSWGSSLGFMSGAQEQPEQLTSVAMTTADDSLSQAFSYGYASLNGVASAGASSVAALGTVPNTIHKSVDAFDESLGGEETLENRRVITGAVAGFVAGTVLTLNPIGGIIGGFIGAGAGAGVNEVNKEISLKRTKADHAFAHLKSFQDRMKAMHEAKEDQGELPTADAAAIEAAFRRADESRAATELGAQPESPASSSDAAAAAVGLSTGAAVGAAGTTTGGDGSSSSSEKAMATPPDMEASDVLLFAMVAGGGGEAAAMAAEREREVAARAAERAREEQEPGRKVAAFLFGGMDRGPLPSENLPQASKLNPINGQRYFVYSSNSARAVAGSVARDDWAGAQTVAEAALQGGDSSSGNGEGQCRWAIWTRDVGYEVHRYPFPSEEAARAQFDRWVYVRVLTNSQHQEVAWSAGWHVAPEVPLADIRDAIEKNK